MNILVVGSGAREQAIAWAVAVSRRSGRVFVAPGNAGIGHSKISSVDISQNDFETLSDFAICNSVEFTIVGPEEPLVNGIVDYFQGKGLKIIGPNASAARLEGSKSFAKEFMKRHRIPTAHYRFFTELREALDYLETQSMPIVIKQDGLAGGKGVVVAFEKSAAMDALKRCEISKGVLIESFLEGREASFIIFSDGIGFKAFIECHDFKRALDGDKGENTGGMGVYAPVDFMTSEVKQKVIERIVKPTLKGMRDQGSPFKGFLYVGLMINAIGDPFVVEFNVRMGDPEAQAIMTSMTCDFVEMCLAALDGKIEDFNYSHSNSGIVNVVIASEPYPRTPTTGEVIEGLNEIQTGVPEGKGVLIFHGATEFRDGKILTKGGRVLSVVAIDENLAKARDRAYDAVAKIKFPSKKFRSDIAK